MFQSDLLLKKLEIFIWDLKVIIKLFAKLGLLSIFNIFNSTSAKL